MSDLQRYLQPTYFMDHDSAAVRAFVDEAVAGASSPLDKAVRIYYAVRDRIRYDPYRCRMEREWFTASHTLAEGAAYCVPKAVLLAAAARGAGIPARLGFADVRNHLTTERLRQLVGGDLYRWHGYVALHLEGQWVKATPAFNIEMCTRFDVKPLDFDGRSDSLMHPYNARSERHMEYVNDYGLFDDLPFDRISHDMLANHPRLLELSQEGRAGQFDRESVFSQ